MRRRWTTLTVVAMVAVVAACGSQAETSSEPSEADPATTSPAPTSENPGPTEAPAPGGTDAPTPTASAPAVSVPDSLAFAAPLVGGGEIDIAQFAGKPVVLWFWAPT